MIVSGNVRRLNPTETRSQTIPQALVRPGRIGQRTTGTHFIQVASAHSRPPSRGPLNWAAHNISVSWRLMLPVSRLAPNGKARKATMTAVVSGRRRYAQWIVQSNRRMVPTRQLNQATSHGSTAHGAKSGSIHGAYTYGRNGPVGW